MAARGFKQDPAETSSTARTKRYIPELQNLDGDSFDLWEIQSQAVMEADGSWLAIEGECPLTHFRAEHAELLARHPEKRPTLERQLQEEQQYWDDLNRTAWC